MQTRPTDRRRVWVGRIVLLLLGTFVLPPLLLESVLRVAHGFVAERKQSEHAGAHCVLCVGDSHTYGVYFAKALSYPSRLQSYLDARLGPSQVSVVPAGRPGASLAQMRAALPELLARHAPDVVVVLGGINDRWNRSDRGAVSDFLARHLRLWTVVLMFSAREDGVPFDDNTERPGPAMKPIQFEGEALQRSIVAELTGIAQMCRASGATPLFATYAAPDPVFAAPDAAIRRAAEENGVELIDLARRFAEILESRSYDELLIPGDFHPRPAGYDLMARAVAQQLLPHFGGNPVAELPELPPPELPSHLRLSVDPSRAGNLVLEGPAGRRFHVYLSRSSSGRGVPLRRVTLPLSADDEIFRLALQLPYLRGALDEKGRADVQLDVSKLASAQLGAEGLLAVATLLRADAPADPDDRLWAEEVSNRVTVVRQDGRPPK
jgi:lysophospholipase L1-like esterase